jgi:hypothetical protein
MKYIFKQIDTYTPSETTVEFTADTLETILEQFHFFLRGSGFQTSGTLDFIRDEDESEYCPKFEPAEEHYEDEVGHSPSYYDTDRNKPFPFLRENFLSDKCYVCGLTREQLGTATCFDTKCPLSPKVT